MKGGTKLGRSGLGNGGRAMERCKVGVTGIVQGTYIVQERLGPPKRERRYKKGKNFNMEKGWGLGIQSTTHSKGIL